MSKSFTFKKKQVEVHIGMGLPGSGKTTYFQSLGCPDYGVLATESGVYKTRIDLDSLMKNDARYITGDDGKLSMMKLFGYATSVRGCENCLICLDSLCLTRDQVKDYLRGLYSLASPMDAYSWFGFDGDYYIVIDQWEENREQCLVNDALRNREQLAEVTIRNAKYEPFESAEQLEQMIREMGLQFTGVRLVTHKVAIPEDWQQFTGRPGKPEDTRYMTSDEWSLGGTVCGYDGYSDTVDADTPKENTELDKFLEEKCPGISFMQYKRIVRECVVQETRVSHDYYGGSVTYAYYKTDMKRLYELLSEMGLA